ncbi:ATP-dependent DNA helicase PIF1-like [Chenopodium quinoa]|uniref:ATP-dependent DNA helicase PIF1-like n=1 Tax=Chenopodium quinoa TaxID=63459 RepID=UPI000B78B46F|nr:ATP-dependent DNA helicase PIF1-like [Chenopodium quinoa]
MPLAVRKLFATVLIFCQPSDPLSLWMKYYTFFSEDFRHGYTSDPLKVKNLTVKSVEWFLESMGSSLAAYGLDHLVQPDVDEIRRTKDIEDALNAPIPYQCLQCKNQLNQAQREAFNVIMDHVTKQIHGAFFIDGPGGTGKTFSYNALYAEIRLMNKIVLPTATSGIVVANIPSGRTAHSRFKIPLYPLESLACNVPKQGSLAALLKETTLIIWDEASMAKKENIESLDVLLRDICNPNLLFGGKIVVFGGDFRQVLLVVPKRTQREAVAASLLQNTEDAFVQLPTEIVQPYDAATPQDMHLTSVAFPEMDMPPFSADIFTTRAILTPINDDVDVINAVLIDKFPCEAVAYKSYDSMIDDDCNIYPTEFLNKLCPGGMSPHELILKPNSHVILLRNILSSSGLCNGTRLICKKNFPNLIECVIAIGHHKGEHVLIPRINLRPSESSGYPFQFQRKQFPLKLSFAMTINKAQGQTLNKVVVYLPRSCFSHGQLYVALSRARQATNVSVITDRNADQVFILKDGIFSKENLIMAPQRKFLDELDTSSKSYKVKVNIAEKGRKQESEKKILYQYIILQDDKKNRMKVTLFSDQIDAYKDVILFRGNYDIANALIRPLDA